MVSERQRELIIAIGKENGNRKVVSANLGMSRGAMRSMLSRAFTGFMEDLELFDENYAVFENSFSNPPPNTHKHLRRIARKMRGR